MTKFAETISSLVAVSVLTEASGAQNQFPETVLGADPERERGPAAALVAPRR
jgi:hypothetical protein